MDDRVFLLVIPLLILFTISMISMTGLDGNVADYSSLNQTRTMSISGSLPSEVIYYAIDGQPKIYANGTIIQEQGDILPYGQTYVNGTLYHYAVWSNASSKAFLGHCYGLYWSPSEQTTNTEIYYEEIGQTSGVHSDYAGNYGWTLNTTLGLIASVVAISAIVAIISLRFLDTGLSETGVHTIELCTFFVALWGVFSVLSIPLITADTLGSIAFLLLTMIYAIGIILNVKA